MCGIVGYLGDKSANPILINGLRRLEYRGYDSAGIATADKSGSVKICKKQGKVADLDARCDDNGDKLGIGHTRWATHGEPSEANAHPHQVGAVALVHNGIIENYQDIKQKLTNKGYEFSSKTDSEVLAGLIDDKLKSSKTLGEAVRQALREVAGTFGIAVISESEPGAIVVARRGSPLILGIGDDEYFIASDASAIVGHTERVIYLEDDQLAVINTDGYDVVDLDNNAQAVDIHKLDQDQAVAEKEGFDHFLIKEIHEQPQVVADTTRGRLGADGSVRLGGLNISDDKLRNLKHILIVGCGTAYFSGVLGKYLLEKLTGVSVSVEVGSEFRYRDAAIDPKDTIALFMSQSGETADTLASLEEVKRRGIHTLGLVNVVGSSLARAVDGGIYLHAGPEISVASTKAYSAMVTALLLFGLHVASLKGASRSEIAEVAEALHSLPNEIEHALKLGNEAKEVAQALKNHDHAFYLGRDNLYPVALEGALKLMEVSYIHAQPYPTGEMKHGPIALIDENFLSVVVLPEDELLYAKTISNIEEIKARKGRILSVSSRPRPEQSDYHLVVPKVSTWAEPLIINVALQLFAYHMAVARGTDVDQPRNLAKSVTVE